MAAEALLKALEPFLVPLTRDVVINEFETNCAENDNSTPNDWVEIYNRGGHPVDVSGWYAVACYSTESGRLEGQKSSAFPDGTKLQPGQFMVLEGAGNWMRNRVDRVCLVARLGAGKAFLADAAVRCGDGCTNPYGQVFEDTEYGPQSWQRVPDGGPGEWTLADATRGVPNASAVDHSILFTRVQYCAQPYGQQLEEYVELTNVGAAAVDLHEWILRDAADQRQAFSLPTLVLESGASVRVYTGELPAGGAGIALGRRAALWSNKQPDTIQLLRGPLLPGAEALPVAQTSYWTDNALALVYLSIDWDRVF